MCTRKTSASLETLGRVAKYFVAMTLWQKTSKLAEKPKKAVGNIFDGAIHKCGGLEESVFARPTTRFSDITTYEQTKET